MLRDYWRLVAGGIHRIFSNSLELLCVKKTITFSVLLPPALMLFIIMKVADAMVLMLELAVASPSIGKVRSITANPLLAATGFYQR